jgi:hypothetical protein
VHVVAPSILAQTALIERGVVQIEDGVVIITEPVATLAKTSHQRSFGITEDEFYENLQQRAPGASAFLKSFLAKAEKLGSGLTLKHASSDENPLNLGTIGKDGLVDTGFASWWGRTTIGRKYNNALASQIGGLVRDFNDGRESALRTSAGRMPRVLDLLPAHETAWLAAIDQYIGDSIRGAASEPMSAKSGEFFYKDKNGKPQDKDLHEPILSGIDRDAEARVRSIGKEQARKAGLTEAEIEKLYAGD